MFCQIFFNTFNSFYPFTFHSDIIKLMVQLIALFKNYQFTSSIPIQLRVLQNVNKRIIHLQMSCEYFFLYKCEIPVKSFIVYIDAINAVKVLALI